MSTTLKPTRQLLTSATDATILDTKAQRNRTMAQKQHSDEHTWVPEIVEQRRTPNINLENVAVTMREESDRGCAVLGAEIMNAELESTLRAFSVCDPKWTKKVLDPLFSGYAPLATFSAKIDICFTFGLLDEPSRRDLHILRQLRNDFAHEPGRMTFKTPKCQDRLVVLLGLPNLTNVPHLPAKSRNLLDHLRQTNAPDFHRAALTFKVVGLAGMLAAGRRWLKEHPELRLPVIERQSES